MCMFANPFTLDSNEKRDGTELTPESWTKNFRGSHHYAALFFALSLEIEEFSPHFFRIFHYIFVPMKSVPWWTVSCLAVTQSDDMDNYKLLNIKS